MAQDVSWPKASEGGKIIGKEEIRAYWTRQWGEFDPHVEPLTMTEEDGPKIRVRVHQLVKNLQGNVLSDSQVFHDCRTSVSYPLRCLRTMEYRVTMRARYATSLLEHSPVLSGCSDNNQSGDT